MEWLDHRAPGGTHRPVRGHAFQGEGSADSGHERRVHQTGKRVWRRDRGTSRLLRIRTGCQRMAPGGVPVGHVAARLRFRPHHLRRSGRPAHADEHRPRPDRVRRWNHQCGTLRATGHGADQPHEDVERRLCRRQPSDRSPHLRHRVRRPTGERHCAVLARSHVTSARRQPDHPSQLRPRKRLEHGPGLVFREHRGRPGMDRNHEREQGGRHGLRHDAADDRLGREGHHLEWVPEKPHAGSGIVRSMATRRR